MVLSRGGDRLKRARIKDNMLKIPESLKNEWHIDLEDILGSRNLKSGESVFKFCYCPKTKEFIFEVRPAYHAEIIRRHGVSGDFEQYIRGIYFDYKKTVYLRGHTREDWLKETETVLRIHGISSSIRIVWGDEAAKELEYDLRGL